MNKGDQQEGIVRIVKVKKGVPTVIEVNGYRYVLKHENQYGGGGKK